MYSVVLTRPLRIEKGGAVLYWDIVTILRGASLEYITELAMPQSQKPRSLLPQIIMWCTLKTHPCAQLKFHVHKILLTGPCFISRKNIHSVVFTYRIVTSEPTNTSHIWKLPVHGLINHSDTKAFVGFSTKWTCRKILSAQTQLFSWGGNFNVDSGS
jgi:hypothetical protein